MKQSLPAFSDAAAGLYIHIPFCISKCAYCSFNSYPAAGRDLSSYMAALYREAESMAIHPWTKKRIFTSLYVGGGTPTIVNQDELALLIDRCLEIYPFAAAPEVTVEANPNTVDRMRLQSLKQAGANRLSIGIQTFSDVLLRKIGRSHTASQAMHAFEAGRAAGFENISIDLIYGLPEQDMEQWLDTVDKALALQPEHCAMYELMLEEGTALTEAVEQGRQAMPEEDVVLGMQEEAEKSFDESGIQRYEISNYAQPGRESRHNMLYWRNGSYIGLGAGAVSCLSGVRLNNIADPGVYEELKAAGRPAYQSGEALGKEAHFRETVIMGLRMVRGVSVSGLQKRFGIDPLTYYSRQLAGLRTDRLIEIRDDRLYLTSKGMRLANQVLADLV